VEAVMKRVALAAVIVSLGFITTILTGQPNEKPKALLRYIDSAKAELRPEQQKLLKSLREEETAVDVELVEIDDSSLDANRLEIPLPDGKTCTVANGRKVSIKEDGFRFVGNLFDPLQDGPPRSVSLSVRKGNNTGSFSVDKFSYNIRPIGNGMHVIIKRDPSKLKQEEPPEAMKKLQEEAASKEAPQANNQADGPAIVEVTVMVLYTPAVVARHGAEDIVKGFVEHVVDVSNDTYLKSQIPVSLKLVHSGKVDYVESGKVATDVDRLSAESDQHIDGIHALRDSSKADVVVMMIEHADAYGMADAIMSNKTTAFAVVDDEVADWYFTFAHEIGHLFGCRHDLSADPTRTPYAFGHCLCNQSKGWRTIMSYDCSGTGAVTRIGYWSNPVVKYPDAVGDPTGTATDEDNARVIRERAREVAGFR
jgi:hypothetical protein